MFAQKPIRFHHLIAIVSLCFLGSCGWQLRGMGGTDNSSASSPYFERGGLPSSLKVISHLQYSPFVSELTDKMRILGVKADTNAPIDLIVYDEVLDKRTVAVSSIGSAAQYELKLTMHYSYQRSELSHANLPRYTLSTLRTFDFEPGNNIAKAEEESTLLREMRQELAERMLYRGQQTTAQTNEVGSASLPSSTSPLNTHSH